VIAWPRAGADRWLFLTPEVEREVPGLLDRLDQGARAVEERRIEELIHRGTVSAWFDYLRDCRGRLERAAGSGGDPAAARRLALVLREQYLLVPSIRPELPDDRVELDRLEELTWTST
jgi:hypothetical protein